MQQLKIFSSLLLSITVVACGPGTMQGGGDDGPEPMPDAPVTSQLDPAACAGFAANAVNAAQTCGTPLPSNAQSQLDAMCKKGIQSAQLCGGNPAAGLDCFETADSTDWVCTLGEPYPYCNGDLGASLGMYCLVALGNPACASGIKCDFDADCGSGMECNGATGQCFSKSAYCVGLPCELDADCPTGETCNGAEGACIVQ